MRTIVIDGRKMESRRELHVYLKERLSFPDYYGGNLDALHDCLGEIGEQTHIVLCHYDALENNLGAYAGSLLRALNDAAECNPFLTVSRTGEKG